MKQVMTEVFVVCNQLGQFWGRKKRWVDGAVAKRIIYLNHRDEGLNLLVELSSRDIELRGELVAVELSDRGIPVVEASANRLVDPDDSED